MGCVESSLECHLIFPLTVYGQLTRTVVAKFSGGMGTGVMGNSVMENRCNGEQL